MIMIGFAFLAALLAACSVGIYLSTTEFRLALFVHPKRISGSIDSVSILTRETGDDVEYIVDVNYQYLLGSATVQSDNVSLFPKGHPYTFRQVEMIKESISQSRIYYLAGVHKGEGDTIAGSRQSTVLVCSPLFYLSLFARSLLVCWITLFTATLIVVLFGTQPGSGDVDIPFKG
jgi:hypothetical protein